MTHYDINEFAKVQNIIKAFEGSDLIGREFTKKEFDKVFKGISSLEWVREQGTRPSGRISWVSSWGKTDVVPFVTLARDETFEMTKTLPYARTSTHAFAKDGTEIKDFDPYDYKYRDSYKNLIDKVYGPIELREVTSNKETFTAHRHFYKVDMDVLKRASLDVVGAREYFDDKIAECERKLAKYKACREAIA